MQEYLRDKEGKPSLSRLLALLSWPPATLMLFYLQSAEALTAYLGAYATAYVGGKFADKLNKAS